jgi:hypothetical protein
MSKKFIITEDEKKHILGLYGLINEEIDPNVGGTVKIINKYAPGFYSVNEEIKKQLDTELAKVTEFVKKYPNSIVSVDFSSQESSIPNTDNEQSGYFKERRLKEGQLSEARKDKINEYIQNYFQGLKNNKIISDAVEIPPVKYTFYNPTKPFISDDSKLTPWCIKGDKQIPAGDTQGYACTGQYYKVNGSTENNWYNQLRKGKGPDGRYNGSGGIYSNYISAFFNEQNSSVTITVQIKKEQTTGSTVTTTTTVSEDCAMGLKIRVYIPSHNCQNAEFFLFANDTLLYNSQGGMTANLNNSNTSLGIPTGAAKPFFNKKMLNPGYGYLPNGDGTEGNYQYGKKSFRGDLEGGRSDTFTVTEEQSAKIIKEGDGYINIWMIATTKSAHKDKPTVTITKNVNGVNKVIYNKQPGVVKGKLLTLDACGNKAVGTDNGKKQPNVTTYLSKLKAQKESIRKDTKPSEGEEEKIDTKQLLLDRTSVLIDRATELMEFILDSPNSGQLKQTQERIAADYNEFYTELNTEPKLTIDSSGKYENKELEKSLFGDVRMDLNVFYSVFNAIYKNSKNEIDPSGAKATGTDKLALSQIKSKLRSVKSTLMV